MSAASRALVRDFAATGAFGDKLEHALFSARDAHDKPPVFVAYARDSVVMVPSPSISSAL